MGEGYSAARTGCNSTIECRETQIRTKLFLLVLLANAVRGLGSFRQFRRRRGIQLLQHGVGDVLFVVRVKENRGAARAFGRTVQEQAVTGSFGLGVEDLADFLDDVIAHPLAA